MKLRLLVTILTLLCLVAPVVSAQEPNTAADNACYEGGVMAGKCTTDWHWTCGWYLARFTNGQFAREQVPVTCAGLLPPLPEPSLDTDGTSTVTGSITCFFSAPPLSLLVWSTSADPTSVIVLPSPGGTSSPGSVWVFTFSGTYSLLVNGVVVATTTC